MHRLLIKKEQYLIKDLNLFISINVVCTHLLFRVKIFENHHLSYLAFIILKKTNTATVYFLAA